MTPDKTEQHRKECEARTVLSWEFKKRRPYLDLVEQKRGMTARKELEKEMIRQNKIQIGKDS